MPELYIIGGPNGAGKTTVALSLLPSILGVFEYVNADAIASGLSPLSPDSMAIRAGRLMLERLQTLANTGTDFAFESTLAARTFVPFLQDCKAKGYIVNLIYFWLRSSQLAVERVAMRVESGGHAIPEDAIRRRYERGQRNLIELYLPLCDRWIVYDNSEATVRIVAEGAMRQQQILYDTDTWNQIVRYRYD
jgi:predicted ABC-type ATPase